MTASADFIPPADTDPDVQLDMHTMEYRPADELVCLDGVRSHHVSRDYRERTGQDVHRWSFVVWVDPDHTHMCEWCNEVVLYDAIERVGCDDVCEECIDNHTVSCESYHCGTRIHVDDSVYRDGSYYCQECDPGDDEYSDGDGIIESYCHTTATTDARFRFRDWSVTGITVHRNVPAKFPALGFELETNTDDYTKRVDAARFMLEDVDDNYLIIKEDGSVSGFEMVTMPADYRAHLELFPWHKLRKLSTDYAMRSWNGGTGCGLHVHISKSAFNSAHIYRFVNFHDHNAYQLTRLAGRESDQWARFGKYDYENRLRQARGLDRTDRYVAVNTQPRDTYELRYFRGSLNPNTVKGVLEFVHALWLFTRDLTVHDVRNGALLTMDKFIEFARDHDSDYPDLMPRLIARGLVTA